MRIKLRLLIGFFAACNAHAAANYTNSAPSIASPYGLVQNVQNYSSNPFWDPNGPYNQRVAPTVVYAQGPDVETGDCRRTVLALIASYCAGNRNCVGLTLSDIRPVIMVQLSRMPGHNFASACAGYIDSEFDTYMKNYAVAAPTAGVAFPAAVNPANTAGGYQLNLENPYQIKKATWNGHSWEEEVDQRKQELKDLQSRNGGGNAGLVAMAFPTTAADYSFEERRDNKAAGYEKYKDAKAYQQIKIESEEEYLNRERRLTEERAKLTKARDKIDMTPTEFCKKYPNDSDCKPASTPAKQSDNTALASNAATGAPSQDTLRQQLIEQIIAAFPK